MSRDLKSIAHEAYDDLVSHGGAHRDARTIFRAIAKLLPAGDLAGELARMGESHSDEWHTYAEDWASRMDCALEASDKLAPQNATTRKRGAHDGGCQ